MKLTNQSLKIAFAILLLIAGTFAIIMQNEPALAQTVKNNLTYVYQNTPFGLFKTNVVLETPEQVKAYSNFYNLVYKRNS
jgi:hypothetical protein